MADINRIGERAVADMNMVKEGDTVIHLGFRRHREGLFLNVKTHPSVEEWFKGLATGENSDVRGIGRYWAALDKEAPLMAYNLQEPIPIFSLDSHRQVRFDWLARPLVSNVNGARLDEAPMPGSKPLDINLAFLRLVGIGESSGITFQIKGVFSEAACAAMRDNVLDGCREFYKKYMKSINMEGAIVLEPASLTQDWRP